MCIINKFLLSVTAWHSVQYEVEYPGNFTVAPATQCVKKREDRNTITELESKSS